MKWIIPLFLSCVAAFGQHSFGFRDPVVASLGGAPISSSASPAANPFIWVKMDSMNGTNNNTGLQVLYGAYGTNNLYHTDSTTKGLFLTNGPNGYPYIGLTTNSSGAYYYNITNTISVFTALDAFLVVIVSNVPPTHAAMSGLWELGNSGSDTYFPLISNGHIYDDAGSSTRSDCGVPVTGLTNWIVYEVASASGNWTNWINGTVQFGVGANTVSPSTTPSVGRENGGNTLRGGIAEFLLYNRVLTSSERTQTVTTYLRAKYGI
jgi:hypothetical protein